MGNSESSVSTGARDQARLAYAISGHRMLAAGDHLIIRRTLRNLDPFPSELLFGGAIGTDTVALEQSAELWPGVKKVVIVPDTLRDQPPTARTAAHRYADQIIELHHPITRADNYNAYRIRNRYLVEHADHLLAFIHNIKSGTGNAITLAVMLKKPHTNIPIKGVA